MINITIKKVNGDINPNFANDDKTNTTTIDNTANDLNKKCGYTVTLSSPGLSSGHSFNY